MLERASDMLDQVLDFVGPRLGKYGQFLGRILSIPFTNICLLETYKSVRMDILNLEWNKCWLAVEETNATFENLTVS